MLFGLLAAAASADPLTFAADPVMTGAYEPAVAWSDVHESLVMVFAEPHEGVGCSQDAWALRVARSDDGVNWQIAPRPLLEPSAEWPCGGTEPAVVAAGGLKVFFRAPGQGIARWRRARPTKLIVADPDLRQPSVVRVDGLVTLMVADASDNLVVYAKDAGWNLVSEPSLAAGVTSWGLDGLYSPALTCVSGSTYPFRLVFGGWTGAEGGFTDAISEDADFWFLAGAMDTWTGGDGFDSWDVVREGDDLHLWLERDGQVHYAWTGSAVAGPLDSRVCD